MKVVLLLLLTTACLLADKGFASDIRTDNRHASDRIHPRRRASLNKITVPKPIQRKRELRRAQEPTNSHESNLGKPAAAAGKIVKTRPPSIPPASGFAIGGQQFRNGRNRDRVPAAIGGSAMTRRSMEAINGSEINGRRLH